MNQQNFKAAAFFLALCVIIIMAAIVGHVGRRSVPKETDESGDSEASFSKISQNVGQSLKMQISKLLESDMKLKKEVEKELNRQLEKKPRVQIFTFYHPTTEIDENLKTEYKVFFRNCWSKGMEPTILKIEDSELYEDFRLEYKIYAKGRRRAALFALATRGGGIMAETGMVFGSSLMNGSITDLRAKINDNDFYHDSTLTIAGKGGISAHLSGSLVGNTTNAANIASILRSNNQEKISIKAKLLLPSNVTVMVGDRELGVEDGFQVINELKTFEPNQLIFMVPGGYDDTTGKLIRGHLDETIPLLPDLIDSEVNQALIEYTTGRILPGKMHFKDLRESPTLTPMEMDYQERYSDVVMKEKCIKLLRDILEVEIQALNLDK